MGATGPPSLHHLGLGCTPKSLISQKNVPDTHLTKQCVTGWMLTVRPAPLCIQPPAARQKEGSSGLLPQAQLSLARLRAAAQGCDADGSPRTAPSCARLLSREKAAPTQRAKAFPPEGLAQGQRRLPVSLRNILSALMLQACVQAQQLLLQGKNPCLNPRARGLPFPACGGLCCLRK